MAKYTEVLHDLVTNDEVKGLIEKALSTYQLYKPVHDELYGYIPTREELNKKIINHYRWYEIGSETVGRFLFNLETTMNEIMPYYNQLYKSIDIMNNIEDIFGNVDIVESYEETHTGNTKTNSTDNMNSNSSSETTSNEDSTNTTNTETSDRGRNVKSITPQSQLSVKTIDGLTAASEMSWNENESGSTANSSNNSTTESSNNSQTEQESTSNANTDTTGTTKHTLSRKGNQGVNTYAHDMLEFRQLFINIEMQILNDPELAKCFMLIW